MIFAYPFELIVTILYSLWFVEVWNLFFQINPKNIQRQFQTRENSNNSFPLVHIIKGKIQSPIVVNILYHFLIFNCYICLSFSVIDQGRTHHFNNLNHWVKTHVLVQTWWSMPVSTQLDTGLLLPLSQTDQNAFNQWWGMSGQKYLMMG